MKNEVNLTSRDKEIIFLVANNLGLSSVTTKNEPSKEDVQLLVKEVGKNKWNKHIFHNTNVAVRSFFRAVAKVDRDVYNNIPNELKSVFPEIFLNTDASLNGACFFVE